jgi:hypothetical protein
MKRFALMVAVVGLLAPLASAEDLSDPPWADDPAAAGFPSTFQHWHFPTLLMTVPPGTEPPPDPPMHPSEVDNPFPSPLGGPFIEWPQGPYLGTDAGGNVKEVFVETTVQWVDYMPPGGTSDADLIPDTPTVHIGVYDAAGDPDTSVPVPVSIWIPNNPDPNLVKKIFWQMTSDKSPTPHGNPPTTNPPGTSVPTGIPQYGHGPSAWYTYNGMNEIRPNPDGEWLTFELVHSTNIEEIVVKTVCMPEPATLGLMALGSGLMVLVRRRRR